MTKKAIRTTAFLLALTMILGAFVSCKKVEKHSGSDSSSVKESSTVSTDSTKSEGSMLLEGTYDATSKTSSKRSATTSRSRANWTIASVPKINENPEDKKAVLPKLDIKNKKISVCIDWDPKVTWVQRWLIAMEHYYPGMTVEWKIAVPEQKASKLALWKSANTSPDLIILKPEESWPTLVNQGLLMPVDKYLDMDTAFWGSVRETNEGLKIGGKQHIMMTSSQPWCHVIYKKDLFTSKKMEDPSSLLFKNKWTWDKLEEYAKALTRPNASDPSKSIYGLHVSSGGNFAATVGKDFCEYDTVNKKWVSNLRDPKVTEAMNFLASLGPMGKKYAPVDIDINEALQMFRTDRIGMLLTHDPIGLHFTDPKEAEMLMSVPYPRYPRSSTYYYPAQITAWGIPQGAKNPVGALALVFTSRALHLQIDTKAIDFGKYETTESKYMYDVQNYFETIATPVVMHTRRLVNLYPVQEGFWTPGFYEGTSWSVTVAQQEPIMLEELKKY